jgi:hypothetical protein
MVTSLYFLWLCDCVDWDVSEKTFDFLFKMILEKGLFHEQRIRKVNARCCGFSTPSF